MWQDTVFSVGNILFSFALVPSICSRDKPNFFTSFITASILTVYVYTFYSLGLSMSAIFSWFTALGWWILCVQRFVQVMEVRNR